MIPSQRDDLPVLVPFDVIARDLDGWVPRATLRVWKHRGRLAPVACDLTTAAAPPVVADLGLGDS